MKRYLSAIAFCLLNSLLLSAAAPAPVFRAGAATSNITPPLGRPIIGNFVAPMATNIHDELHARCLVLDDGKTKLALVTLDLLGSDANTCVEARGLIEKQVGIPAANILISGVHTHSACSFGGTMPLKGPQYDNYHSFVVQRIVDGVQCAANRLRPAQLACLTAQAPEHVFNRRWFQKEGTVPPNPFGGIDKVKMNPRSGSPDLIKPAGPTDPTVTILALREPDGKPIAVYSAYSLHYVGGVPKGSISADYYGVYCKRLEQLMQRSEQDPPMVALMANASSGDINNVNFFHPRPAKKPYEQIQFVANDVAAKVHAALAKAEYSDKVSLAARFREQAIDRPMPTAEQIAWAKERLTKPGPKPDQVDLPYSYARRVMDMAKREAKANVPLQVLRIGPACIGTMPGEPFCEIGLEFRQRSGMKPAVLVEWAHGGFGYIPTAKHFEWGGYETWLGSCAFEPHASEKLLDTLMEMVAEVREAK
ncbi:MAG: neutral/alkaline non-lysosomal ceramidase N-terminal domain-containing protein [Verrucomicrobia bacterium]|nr:neutral/alkaline non-lysosomal ceramidase N-terminal domain-containing protein [Verrucomicrobiota bacterium]